MSPLNASKSRFLHITYIAGFLFIKVLVGLEALARVPLTAAKSAKSARRLFVVGFGGAVGALVSVDGVGAVKRGLSRPWDSTKQSAAVPS